MISSAVHSWEKTNQLASMAMKDFTVFILLCARVVNSWPGNEGDGGGNF